MKLNLEQFASDPLAFQKALMIPSVHGPKRFADCMGDFQQERFEGINPALLSIAKGEKPDTGRFWWEATKGASKDSDLACCLLYLLAFSKVPLTCQIGAADRDQADEMRKAAKDILRLNDWLAARVEILSLKIVCKATESEAEIIPADITGSHGARPSVVIINELSHIQKLEFAENLMDNSAKVPHGLAIIATNSGYRGTWQKRWRDIAVSSDNWKCHIYSRPAPWLDPSHVEESKRRNSIARFNRLFYGIWPRNLGDALDENDISSAIDPNLQPQRSKQHGISYVAALDLGIKQDHSALIVIGANRETLQLQLASCQSWAPDPSTGKVDLMAVERAVLTAHRAFDLKAVGFDPHQAALMSQRLELQKVRMQEMVFTGKNLDLMASTLLDVFRTRRISVFEDKLLLADLGKLCIEERPFGYKLTAVKDEFGHADRAIALSIALPLAVAEAGRVPISVGVWRDNEDQGVSAFSRAMKDVVYQNREIQQDREMLDQISDTDDPMLEISRR